MIDNQMDNNGVTTTATVPDVDGSDITVEFQTEGDYLMSAEFTLVAGAAPGGRRRNRDHVRPR